MSSIHSYERKSSSSLSAALAHHDTEWRWPVQEEPFSISEPQGASLCAIFCVRPERKGRWGQRQAQSHFQRAARMASTSCIIMGFKLGAALGSHFSWSAVIDSPYSQGHLWEKLNLCLSKQVPEREGLLPCWRSHLNFPSCSIILTSCCAPKCRDHSEDKLLGFREASWGSSERAAVTGPLSSQTPPWRQNPPPLTPGHS